MVRSEIGAKRFFREAMALVSSDFESFFDSVFISGRFVFGCREEVGQ